MIFLNPWALLGLLAVAAPIAAHLFARRAARRQMFPTLRFLPQARLTPVRRARLTDLGLLALRCTVIATAAVALAQPACRVADPGQAVGDEIARAILIDTSASMSRESAPGVGAVDAARREAATLAAGAALSRVVESESPHELIDAGVAWLATLSMRREVVIVSDFQRGQIGRADLARIPADIGVRPVQIAAQGEIAAPSAGSRTEPAVTILTSPSERAGAETAWQAAVARGAPVSGPIDRPVAIVFPGYDARGTVAASGKPLDRSWMFDVIAAIRNDSLSYLYRRGLSWSGGTVNDRAGLVLITDATSGSVAAAALLAATARAVSGQPDPGELSSDIVSIDELAQWTREAGAHAASPAGLFSPQGRWLWATVLVLLLVEAVVRRSESKASSEENIERAA